MLEILYYLFIYPIYLIIDVLFHLLTTFNVPLWFIIFLISYLVNLISLPMYLAADRMQQEERDLQDKMAPRVKSIKENFKGAERYMILSTYYRQNHYHPIMALRKSLSIAIQIPFFMAAYLFFSHLQLLNGVSLGFIKDLGMPDGLFVIGDFKINILPILMTVINIFSAQIYAKNLKLKDKIQIYTLPLIFLVLLYNSPAGLVLYWTFNQLISLIRNIVLKLKNSGKIFVILNILLALIVITILVANRTFSMGSLQLLISFLVLLFPGISIYIIQLKTHKNEPLNKEEKNLFFLTSITTCICISLLIHSNLFLTSPLDFSLGLLFTIFIQSIGLFFILPGSLYLFTGNAFKRLLLILGTTFLFLSIANIIHVGPTTRINHVFAFRDAPPAIPYSFDISLNYLICLLICQVIALLFYKKKIKTIIHLVTIILISCTLLSGFNIIKLYKFYQSDDLKQITSLSPKIHLSKEGNNVIVFMMDRMINSYLPIIFEEKPELYDIYTGFTYYPNTVSFYAHSILGMPAILGGYEYRPEILDERPEKFEDKYKESLLVLPSIFRDNNFSTLMIDVSLVDYKHGINGDLYKKNNIGWAKLAGRYNSLYLEKYPNMIKNLIIQKRKGLMFSIVRALPMAYRNMFHERDNYLLTEKYTDIPRDVFDAYPIMYFLPKLTDFTNKKNTFTFIDSLVPHYRTFLEYPSYTLTGKSIPGEDLVWKGKAKEPHKHYHVAAASLLLIGKFIQYLKDNEIYDNTRIIIVADHGDQNGYNKTKDDFFNSVTVNYNPILFVKDFNSTGQYKTDNTLMTIADVPLLALKDIVDNPINPFSNKVLTNKYKDDGVMIFKVCSRWNTNHFPGSKVFDKDSEFLKVKDNIFDRKNWIVDYKYK